MTETNHNYSGKINDIRAEGESLVFDPYNPANREITEHEVCAILKRFGVPDARVHNMHLYKRAFVHKSYVKRPDLENQQKGVEIAPQPANCMPLRTKSNDRLEFVGDGVLELVTKYYLYERFPKSEEGFMTDAKIALVKNEAIGQLALDMGLHKWYVISRNAEQKNTRTNVKKLGNLFEAFLGALFLDYNKVEVRDEHGWFKNAFMTGPGFQMAQVFLIRVFETPGLVPWQKIIEFNDNYKNQLQVIVQKEFKTVPHYVEIAAPALDSAVTAVTAAEDGAFYMGVFLCLGQPIHAVQTRNALPLSQFDSWAKIHEYTDSNKGRVFIQLGAGKNKIKKKAEQSACKEALDLCLQF